MHMQHRTDSPVPVRNKGIYQELLHRKQQIQYKRGGIKVTRNAGYITEEVAMGTKSHWSSLFHLRVPIRWRGGVNTKNGHLKHSAATATIQVCICLFMFVSCQPLFSSATEWIASLFACRLGRQSEKKRTVKTRKMSDDCIRGASTQEPLKQ